MKKNLILKGVLVAGLSITGFMMNSKSTFAHGYVESPKSRGYIGSLEKNQIGWDSALKKYGIVITNPQSLEYKKGFPQAGPPDGRIASANGGLGQISDFVLDEQGIDRWEKQPLKGGLNLFKWKYTAPHSTSKWHYYITKKGWNPNKPLSRDDFELIGEIKHDGSSATTNPLHYVNVPTDRSGYHVILAVWDVADTQNAFYNVIDVDLQNGPVEEDKTPPTTPNELKASNVTDKKIELSWKESADNVAVKGYEIYRNNKLIDSVNTNKFTDINLSPSTKYTYKVRAVDISNNKSEFSKEINVTTSSKPVIEAPKAPESLHSMGTTTNSVDLMWMDSNNSDEVNYYEIYRDRVLIGKTNSKTYLDKNLKADTKYEYYVRAVGKNGLISENSNVLEVRTNKESSEGTNEWKAGTIMNPVLYTAGDVVTYKGKEYIVIVTHYNYGDTNWAPGSAQTLFKAL